MSWNPNCTVTVDGVDFSGKTINAVSINYGRTSFWEQARSSIASIEIANWDATNYGFAINDLITITVDNATGVARTVFKGNVTNISNSMNAVGTVNEVVVITLTAVGPFAKMSRTIVGNSGYPRELDSVRMNKILTDSGATIDIVDSPGIYEFTDVAAFTSDGYSTASKYASMSNGYIYETTDGKVGFANESRRSIDVTANGYMNIPENYILWRSISSQTSFTDIVNEVQLTYKSGGVTTASDATSQSLYGLLSASISTELHNASEAAELANKYIALRRVPGLNMSAFTIPIDSPNVSNANLDALIQMKMGKAISITGLPTALIPVNYQGFVEGWNLSITRTQVFISLVTTDNDYSIQPSRWQDVTPSLTWATTLNTVQWATVTQL